MSTQRNTVTPHPCETLLNWVKSGEIAIPEVQRPFVREATNPRNLLDSLYWGFPVGYLIGWRNPKVTLKDGSSSMGKRVLIDGKQRVTARVAALLCQHAVTKDYERVQIRIQEAESNFVSEYRLLIDESRDVIVEKFGEFKEKIEDGTLADCSFGNLHGNGFGQHIYQPLLHFRSDCVDVSPVSLNESEKEFVTDLRSFDDGNPSYFKYHELYLLRNMCRGRGIGFLEAGNLYHDFLLWLLNAEKQFVSFIDPKGIRNLEGPDDRKIRFYRTIKELEARLGDPNVILNSFIIANPPFQQVCCWTEDLPEDKFTKAHVVFQKEDRNTYIKRLLTTAASDQQVTVEA